MKYVLVVILSINVCLADWIRESDYLYIEPCNENKQVVFIYHGLNTTDVDLTSISDLGKGLNEYVDYLLEECTLVVMPLAGRHQIHGKSMQMWDMTGQLTYGADVARQIELIMLAKRITGAPVYLVGGSAGALMAYRVANTMAELGIDLDGLVMLDGVNPYHMNIYNTQDKEVLYYFAGHNLIRSAYTGSADMHVDTLILLSLDDPITPDEYKLAFVYSLLYQFDSIEYGIYGTGHDIGEEGIDHLIQWFQLRI